jgi:hypothetical protein
MDCKKIQYVALLFAVFLLAIFSCEITPDPDPFVGGPGPVGGFIFYDKGFYSDGWRYMEAAPESTEFFDRRWSLGDPENSGFFPLLNTSKEIGTGQENTNLILTHVNSQSPAYSEDVAAVLVDNLVIGTYDDWFLPSEAELNLMYENLHLQGLGGFNRNNPPINSSYWSSSEEEVLPGALTASGVDITFHDGNIISHPKNDPNRVRAARRF